MSKSKLPIRSVPSRTEQYTKLLHPGTTSAKVKYSFISEIDSNPLLSLSDKAVIELLYLYGLRISEVLKISTKDISPTGHIFIQTLKGGKTRMILPVKYAKFWYNATSGTLPLVQIFSRNYFYRLFLKCGYQGTFKTNENKSVTHFFRHKLVQDLRKSGFDNKTISQFLSHSSGKSVEHYG